MKILAIGRGGCLFFVDMGEKNRQAKTTTGEKMRKTGWGEMGCLFFVDVGEKNRQAKTQINRKRYKLV